MLSEYKEVFLEELEEQLQLMDDEILKLEQNGNSEQIIQSLFRAAHTLKGSSAAMGFEDMKQLTHEMEHLLDQVRSKAITISDPLIDLLFKSLDVLKQLKLDIESNQHAVTDITDCIRELQLFSELAGADQDDASGQSRLPLEKPPLNLDMKLKIQEVRRQGKQVYWLFPTLSADCIIKGARAYLIGSQLSELGEVLLAFPDFEDIDEQCMDALQLTFLFAGSQLEEELHTIISQFTEVSKVSIEALADEEFASSAATAANTQHMKPSAEKDSKQPMNKMKSQTIRVSVERLEHLMNLVGELVIDQTRIHQVERIQSRRFSDDTVEELGQISDHLSRTISDLQDSVMKTRMLPIEQLFNRFPRMIRDLSHNLDKEIELVIEGKDTELDRTLIEEIADPLIHLIRNAVDHGVERPEVREQMEKSRKGTLQIKAAHKDNQVVIYVEDDGAGIDPDKMKQSAMKKGVITFEEAEQMSDREAIELIFRPGFSTASKVSDVSGRGVGMDIVKSHIEKLNGIIDIDTKLGRGTRFKIKLPLTLAIIVGLLVKLQEQTYIIPMSNIIEIIRVKPDELQHVRGQEVVLLRNQVIPVVWMHTLFQLPKSEEQTKEIPLVIVGSAEKRMALAVDALIGNQEIVIKNLGSYIGKVDYIAGATILGDGRVALIAEIPSMMNTSVR
ncbi:chemotaxis protein CheW [Marinicrinis lubricantis]|uniref:Chemotaxis protein CheA n=1 Tax=Marinicrinis lubricantis TaxID=2086470 RepID=A0ABW1IPJ7_9BACL